MPESQKYSLHRAWKLIRKALSSTEQRDWWDEYEDSINDIDADVQGIVDTTSGLTAALIAYDHTISGLMMTQVQATVTDTPITLTNQSPRNILLTGSASGVNVVLPDATTLTVGDTWTIKNASSEFVVVQNSDGSKTWNLLSGEMIEMTVSDVSTDAGVWEFAVPVLAADDVDQSITGEKTFTSPAMFAGGTQAVIGDELITTAADRDFSGAGNWTGTGWTVGSGVYTHVAGANNATLAGLAAIVGGTYQITVTVVTTTAGTLGISFGGASSAAIGQSTGTLTNYTVLLTASSVAGLLMVPSATWAGTVDNVSVKQITLADSALDLDVPGAPLIGAEFRSPSQCSFGIGYKSLSANTTGGGNTAAGFQSLSANTTGAGNTAAGYKSLSANTTGNSNSAAGFQSLSANTTGINNTAAGFLSLSANTTGVNNTANGGQSLSANTTGGGNTAAGYKSLSANTTGANNTAAGFQAGQYYGSGTDALTSPASGVFMGYQSRANSATSSNEIVIGANAIGAGSNTATIGDTAITKTVIRGVIKLNSALNTAPDNATATGEAGEIRVTATHIYVCTATNTWVRAGLATWYAYPMALTDDTPIVLTNQSPRNILLTGSASGVNVVLPDATTVFLGDERVHTNSSLECVIIRNSDSTVMVWLMPHETVTFRCVSIASAAGKWEWTKEYPDEHLQSRWSTDFFESTTTGATPVMRGYSSGGGLALVASPAASALREGVGVYGVGTSAGGYFASTVPGDPSIVLGGGSVLLEFDHGILAPSTVAEEYILRLGLGDTRNASDNVDGVYFEYDRLNTTGGANLWKIAAMSNSTPTKVETAVTPTRYGTEMQRFAIVVNSAGTRADFWINFSYVGKVETNVPNGHERATGITFEGTKTAGSATRYGAIGYVKFAKSYLTRR